jgi:hypothetical protein
MDFSSIEMMMGMKCQGRDDRVREAEKIRPVCSDFLSSRATLAQAWKMSE